MPSERQPSGFTENAINSNGAEEYDLSENDE
jgi:hypothetical protein